MNREQHQKAAEAHAGKACRLLKQGAEQGDRLAVVAGQGWAQVALVYATLAAAPVTPMPAPDGHGTERYAECYCGTWPTHPHLGKPDHPDFVPAPAHVVAAERLVEEASVRLKDCTMDGVPIPNTDGTVNKYASRYADRFYRTGVVPGQDQIEATLGRYDDQDPHVDGCLCPLCAPVPSDGPGQ